MTLSYLNNAGVLACLDSYMNIALEQTEEYVSGQVYQLIIEFNACSLYSKSLLNGKI